MFDYDHHDNCEAFANLLIGADAGDVHGVMEYNVHPCVAAFCCLVNCFRSCRERENLRDVVQRKLDKREILN